MIIASPCINLCRMDPHTQLCQGCSRTLGEITAWSQLDGPARQRVLEAIAQRHRATPPAPQDCHD